MCILNSPLLSVAIELLCKHYSAGYDINPNIHGITTKVQAVNKKETLYHSTTSGLQNYVSAIKFLFNQSDPTS